MIRAAGIESVGFSRLLKKLIEERPVRASGNKEGKIILHFDTAGILKKVEETNAWSSYNA